MGGLWRKMPVTAGTFILAAISMAGIPPLSGFWSKEEILTAVSIEPPFLAVAMLVSFLTAFYITRAMVLTFFGRPQHESEAHEPERPRSGRASGFASSSEIHESPVVMTVPLLILAVGAAGVGLLGSPWLGHRMQHFLGVEAGHPEGPHWLESASVLIASAGIALALVRYGLGWQLLPEGLRVSLRPLYRLAAGKYFVDETYEALLLRPIRWIARKAFAFDADVVDGAVNGAGNAGLSLSRIKRWVDERIVDGAVNGAAISIGQAGGAARLLQTGLVQNYLLIALGGALAIFFVLR